MPNHLANLWSAATQCAVNQGDTFQRRRGGPDGSQYSHSEFSSRSSRRTAGYSHMQQRDDSDVVMEDPSGYTHENGGKPMDVAAMVAAAKKANSSLDPYMNEQQQRQAGNVGRGGSFRKGPQEQQQQQQQPESREPVVCAKPPEGAEKKRCYRLNLEFPPAPSIDPATSQHIYGPLIYEPPVHHLPQSKQRIRASTWHSATMGMQSLHVSNSADTETSKEKSEVQIAISTAQIFRGITVDKNGTILTQNARASRAAKKSGENKKVGEKSRQVAKIDKAKDLVDEDGDGGIDPNSKTQCLYIMGEYDDMKWLVKDGAKKLRDATNLTDEALLSINRQRTSSASFSNPATPSRSPSRKRISPYPTDSGNAAGMYRTSTSSSQARGATTPKIKANPRDSKSSNRRLGIINAADCMGDNENSQYNASEHGCNDIGITFGKKGNDWSNLSNKLGSIWNCGATVNSDGTMSPTNPSSPAKRKSMNAYTNPSASRSSAAPIIEGRNEAAYGSRGDGRSERVA